MPNPGSTALRFIAISSIVALSASCDVSEDKAARPGRQPVSVRGWIAEIQTTPTNYSVVRPMSDAALRADLFYRTNVYVEKSQFSSGGMAESGGFMILDVPPGDSRIVFQIPGHPDASLSLTGIPGNADVMAAGLIVTPQGVTVSDPKKLRVRVPAKAARKTGTFCTIAGARVEVEEVPLSELGDRRDYPEPDRRSDKPLAIVR